VQDSESDEADLRRAPLQTSFATGLLGYGAILITPCVASELARLHVDAAYNDEIYLKEWLIRAEQL